MGYCSAPQRRISNFGLIDRHQLQGVVSMPDGVFKPYAGVSMAVLIFTKIGTGGTGDVWYYDMRADGYS